MNFYPAGCSCLAKTSTFDNTQSNPSDQDAVTFHGAFTSVSLDNQLVQIEKRHYYSQVYEKRAIRKMAS